MCLIDRYDVNIILINNPIDIRQFRHETADIGMHASISTIPSSFHLDSITIDIFYPRGSAISRVSILIIWRTVIYNNASASYNMIGTTILACHLKTMSQDWCFLVKFDNLFTSSKVTRETF